MTTALLILIVLPPVVLFYTWCVYPLLLLAFPVRLHRIQAGGTADTPPRYTPPLIIILSAFNEAGVIAARIRNLLETDYPAGRITLLVGTDGCTDQTAGVAREAAAQAPHVRVIEQTVNRGKVAMLRELVALASTIPGDTPPLLVFTDANTTFLPDALQRLTRHFLDPRIGGVCGRLIFKGAGSSAERTYWNLENRLKERESLLDSCLGANGAIYAIRPECFWQDIPANTIVDDFVIGMKVREAGLRMVYDPLAIAEEDIPDIRDEWGRRRRIGSGNYQAARFCKACLHPRFGVFAWCFWSHKILRWFTPHLILLTLIPSVIIVACSAFRPLPPSVEAAAITIVFGAALLLASAATGRLSRRRHTHNPLVRLCRGTDHFVTMQAALLAGYLRYLRGNLSGAWTRTPRNFS